MTAERKRGAILISGRGSNMVSLLQAAQAEDFPVAFSLVISDKIEAPGLSVATSAGIKTHALQGVREGREHWEADLDLALREAEVDVICLAGFMRMLSADFVSRWSNRILNIHPSLLPDFPGLDAQAQALDAGVEEAGCTVHVVTAQMDAGPILGQARVRVHESDSVNALSDRILAEEHKLYPAMVAQYVQDTMTAKERVDAI